MRRAALCLLAAVGCTSEPLRDADGNVITSGKYRIRTFPRGVEVYLDGELAIPKTPGTLILEAGDYTLRLQHPHAKEGLEESITVEAGREKTLDVRVPPPDRPTLSVISDVEDASVRVKGYWRGTTPMDPVNVKAGPVDVTVTTPEGRARAVRAHVDWGEDEVLQVNFRDSPPIQEGATGHISLILAPEGWVEDAEGERLGETPLRRVELPAGLQALRLRTADGQRARDVQIAVPEGGHALYRFLLDRDDAVPDAGLPALSTQTFAAPADAGLH